MGLSIFLLKSKIFSGVRRKEQKSAYLSISFNRDGLTV